MKALSIDAEYAMKIFQGEKKVEWRSWTTDYRGDLLICATAEKKVGCISGHAYFVVELKDVVPFTKKHLKAAAMYEVPEPAGYAWLLGEPEAIYPIPVKGQLGLFNVDDSLIRFPDDDINDDMTDEEIEQANAKFADEYLVPLIHTMPGLDDPGKPDLHVEEMFEVLSMLEPHPPITSELDCWESQYPSQKGHLLDWFLCQPIGGGTGEAFTYTRKKGNESTRTAYNRFMNPGGLLWLAEALGENENTLREAVAAAKKAEEGNFRARCTAFRKVIPFERIVELIKQPKGWLYCPAILPMLDYDEENGQPFIKDEYADSPEYNKIIDDELGAFA